MAPNPKRALQVRKHFEEFIKDVESFIDTELDTANINRVNLYLNGLHEKYKGFLKAQAELEELDDTELDSNIRVLVDKKYYLIRPMLEDRLDAIKEARETKKFISPKDAETLSFKPKLPELTLETFSGDITKWKSFFESFNSHVHKNPKLSEITKFQYLRNSVKGPAAKTFENLDFVSENYEEARLLLIDRFDKPNIIAEEHIRSLFAFKSMDKPNSKRLLEMLDEFNSHLRSLKTLGRPVDYWDDLIVYMISSKFDSETKSKWRDEAPSDHLPSLKELTKFIKLRSQKLDFYKVDQTSQPYSSKSSFNPPPKRSQSSFIASKGNYHCVHCNKSGHTIMRCTQFLGASIENRREIVEKLNLCFNCLKPSHFVQNCPNKSDRCRICKVRHHTLLHVDQPQSSIRTTPSTPTPCTPSTSSAIAPKTAACSSFASSSVNSSYVFLATAVVEVIDEFGTPVLARVLLDSGSQINFVTEAFAMQLGLRQTNSKANIRGIGGISTSISKGAFVELKSRHNSYSAKFEALIIPKIADNHPYREFNPEKLSIPANIQLADPYFFSPHKIDILIGAELFFEIQSVGQIKLGTNLPLLQNTRLGWVVSGKSSYSETYDRFCNHVSLDSDSEILEQLVEKFWKLENDDEVPNSENIRSNKWDQHFTQTYSRDNCGRFVVRLPFTKDPACLGDSATMAKKRFLNLEKKLEREPELRRSYNLFMNEYEGLGHMEFVTSIENHHYYFPHHCVIKPDSSSTKLRVVFDGSACTRSKIALNEILAVGPVVQNELPSIILRFRSPAYAMSADIEKMFRQILVHPDDQNYQYVFWRNKPSEALRTYRLKTVTYGTTSAPFLSTRCLLQLALDFKSTNTLASSSIQNDIYVDDWLSGSNSIDGAIQLRNQVFSILQSAGMIFRKWCSNAPEILHDIPDVDKEQFLHLDDSDYIKTLGIFWNSNQDSFRIKISPFSSNKVTKRIVTSEVAKIYDPVGFVSPLVVLGKMFMQRLWQLKVNWDESLPMEHHTQWVKFREDLSKLNRLSIPRHLFDGSESPTGIQIHGFADASEKAYGAALYVRSISSSNHFCVRLLCSKSRVAPLRKTTLPRLELCAAQVLAKLFTKVKPILNFSVDESFFWSDSMITLHWIKSSSSRWQTFVANRVSSIQSLTDSNCWLHVESKSNPADLISRGMTPDDLINSELWWNGPSFLQSADHTWNRQSFPPTADDLPERRKTAVTLTAIDSQDVDVYEGIDFRDDFMRFRKTVSYVLRFIQNIKPRVKRIQEPEISPLEWDSSLKSMLRVAQQKSFPVEYKGLGRKDFVVRHPSLKSLSLFLDNDSIIRVGGRLEHSNLAYSAKHPALLPKDHYLTLMILKFLHRKHLHVGPQGLLAVSRQHYWPISGRRLAKTICRSCELCVRANPKPLRQKMGDLPSERVNMAPPFYHVGVDYCGPFYIHHRIRGKTATKTYLAVFVCFVTKAIHLELASDLSSESFLGTFKRFIATRGLCKRVVSDNGTNFVGANRELNELAELHKNADLQEDINHYCRTNEITWVFAPPGSPHFGGLYEAGVKSAKHHLRRMIGNANLTYEQFNTLIKQVEAVLNSRPLTPIPTDDDTIQILTPGHFLIGRPLTSIPEPGNIEDRVHQLQRWRLVQSLHKQFWLRWSTEYLQSLQHRYFWANPTKNIPVGTTVLIKDDNLPPLKWKYGKIVEVHPGPDGLVRVVTVKTPEGTYKRAVTKICPLPGNLEHGSVQGGENENANKK